MRSIIVAILPIYTFDQSVLRKKAKQIKVADDGLVALASDMLETMHQANGIGLAANQVGSLQRIIVVDLSGMEEIKDFVPLVMLNPQVIFEEGQSVLEEGCLSLPDIRDEVERSESIKVHFMNLAFEDKEIEAEGLVARVIQHEIDHLNGVLFIDHLNAVKRKLLRGRLNKIRRGEIEVDYPVISNVSETPKHPHVHASVKG
jgi:peptide deformylase